MDIWTFNPGTDQDFLGWLEQHPDGYVVNIDSPASEFGMLHRGRCSHFRGNGDLKWAEARKVCAETQFMVDRWSREQLGGIPVHCRDCL